MLSSRIGSNWWRTDGIRVKRFHKIHNSGNSQWDSKHDGRMKVWTWAVSKEDHLHVHVQWHFLVNSWKWRKLCCEFYERCNIHQTFSIRMLVIFGTWLWEKVVWNSVHDQFRLRRAYPIFQATSLLEKGELKSKGGGKTFTTTEAQKQLNWFFARLFLSISSVSTEQPQICATNQVQIQEIKPKVWFVNLWWCRLRLQMLKPRLWVQHLWHKEICCKNTRWNSQLSEDQKLSKHCEDAGF